MVDFELWRSDLVRLPYSLGTRQLFVDGLEQVSVCASCLQHELFVKKEEN